MHTTAEHIRKAFEAGAAGYLPKTVKTDELLLALEQVAQGEPYISPALSRSLIGAMIATPAGQAPQPALLTEDQAALLKLAGKGMPTSAIARELGISLAVAKHRFAAVYRALGARDRGEALIKAARLGIIE